MAFRCMIKIAGVNGPSKTKSGFIDVESFSWGGRNDIRAWEAKPTGTATAQDFVFTKRWDPTSPSIFTMMMNGKKIDTVEVSLVMSSGSEAPKEFASYKFSTVYITSVSTSGTDGSDAAHETVSLNFAKAEYKYEGGAPGGFDVGKGGIKGQ